MPIRASKFNNYKNKNVIRQPSQKKINQVFLEKNQHFEDKSRVPALSHNLFTDEFSFPLTDSGTVIVFNPQKLI